MWVSILCLFFLHRDSASAPENKSLKGGNNDQAADHLRACVRPLKEDLTLENNEKSYEKQPANTTEANNNNDNMVGTCTM